MQSTNLKLCGCFLSIGSSDSFGPNVPELNLDVWTLAKEMYAEHNQLTFRTQDLEMSLQRKINMGMPKTKTKNLLKPLEESASD